MRWVKRLNSRARRCPICQCHSKKKGFTSAKTQRWYCKHCRYSFTDKRDDQARIKQFVEFIRYVTDTLPRRAHAKSLSTWDRAHEWCWHTAPIWEITGEVYDQVLIDGTYIAYGWCVLIAYTTGGVIAYQLCQGENKAAYIALLERIPAPAVVVTDGDKGALSAIKQVWPQTRVQRCLVHIQRNIRRLTTLNPKTEQHQALRHLSLELTKITTRTQAIEWIKSLAAFHTLYDEWLNEKTYREDTPADQIPAFARKNKKWWYTHHQTRSIVHALDRHIKDGVLFTFLEPPNQVTSKIVSTTNPLEGGANSPLKAFLHAHRGWPEEHMLTAINYFLYNRSINPQPLTNFINNNTTTRPAKPTHTTEGPVEIDHAINTQAPWEDGLNIRHGRIGT